MRFYTCIEGGPSPTLVLTGELQDFLTLADALETRVTPAVPGAVITLPELRMDGTDIRSLDFQIAASDPSPPATASRLTLTSKLSLLIGLLIVPALICFVRGLIFLFTHSG